LYPSEVIAHKPRNQSDQRDELIEAGIEPEELIEETALLARVSQPALERMLDWWLEDLGG
jgi:hypothetical protein